MRQKEEAYRLATAKEAVRDIKQFFIPANREDDVREIKEDIAYLKEDLEEIAADTFATGATSFYQVRTPILPALSEIFCSTTHLKEDTSWHSIMSPNLAH